MGHESATDAAQQTQTARVFIYTLTCPISGEVRYVGKAISLEQRLGTHLKQNKGTHKDNWIQSLKKKGLAPIIESIEEIVSVNESDWQEAERFWIETLRFLGCRLTNAAVGGLGGGGTKHWKADSRAKMLAASKAHFADPKNRERHSAIKKGKPHSAEHHKNWLASPKCQVNTEKLSILGKNPENKAKASSGLKSKWKDPEWRAKMLTILRSNGGNKSAEARARMSAARKGIKRSPESVAKGIASRIGYHHSELTKLKIRLRKINQHRKNQLQLL